MTFAEAVAFAKALRTRAEAGWLDPAVTGPLELEGLHVACSWLWRGIPGRRAQMRAGLEKLAGEHAKVQEWLRRRVATALETGEPIPPVFIEWLAQWLRDPKAPRGKGGNKTLSTRDEILAFAVRELVKRGLPRSRNEASPARSAVDAVAAAWGIDWRAVKAATGPARLCSSVPRVVAGTHIK